MSNCLVEPRKRCGVAQWVARRTRNVEIVGSSPIKGPSCFLEQETLPCCLVLVGSRNAFERDFTIDCLKCRIIRLVKYRQNQIHVLIAQY